MSLRCVTCGHTIDDDILRLMCDECGDKSSEELVKQFEERVEIAMEEIE